MKKALRSSLALVLVLVMVFAVACTIDNGTDNGTDGTNNGTNNGGNPPTPPDGNPPDGNGGNGGGTAETPAETDESYTSTVTAGTIDLSALAADTTIPDDATTLATTESKITASGNYVLSGKYANGISIAKGLTVHLYLNGATIAKADGVALQTGKKCKVTISVVQDTTNSISTSGTAAENAIHVKGTLDINGSGTLNVTSVGKNAVKVSKALQIVDATLVANGANHAIACGSLAANNADITVAAVKDGINADCDFDNSDGKTDYKFTTDEGFVSLVDCTLTANVQGDGIQAETFVYFKGGKADITTVGTLVEDTTTNRTTYGLEADDFRYVRSGNTYRKVADDERTSGTKYAFITSCKGVKVGVVEYEVTTTAADNSEITTEYTVDDGDYCLVVDGTELTVDSYDDALHVNNGNAFVLSGKLTLATLNDGLTADGLVRISGGDITVTTSYEGIEGAYVEIVGGNIDVTSSDDGLNAASDDTSIVEHIIISGGTVVVNAQGDGLDSNGTILIGGGTVSVYGPTNGGNGGLDADGGILVNGGTLFVVSANGMVETPASNSTQYVINYAQSATIAANTVIKLVDADGNVIVERTVPKTCQSVIISSAQIVNGGTYTLYVGSTTTSITVSSIVTSAGTASSGGGFNPGGGQGGPGGGGFGPGGR